MNSQPNSRSADSKRPTFYFLPKFTTEQPLKPGVHQYEQRFWKNHCRWIQQECGKTVCSNGSFHNWLNAHRPKVSFLHIKDDYCDTCARLKAEINSKQTIRIRLLQSSNADADEVKKMESDFKSLGDTLPKSTKDSW